MVTNTQHTASDADVAGVRLYEAEYQLHIAHQSHDDNWIRAASDRLHEAVLAYRVATDAAAHAGKLQ
jgi:hypothetical protein